MTSTGRECRGLARKMKLTTKSDWTYGVAKAIALPHLKSWSFSLEQPATAHATRTSSSSRSLQLNRSTSGAGGVLSSLAAMFMRSS